MFGCCSPCGCKTTGAGRLTRAAGGTCASDRTSPARVSAAWSRGNAGPVRAAAAPSAASMTGPIRCVSSASACATACARSMGGFTPPDTPPPGTAPPAAVTRGLPDDVARRCCAGACDPLDAENPGESSVAGESESLLRLRCQGLSGCAASGNRRALVEAVDAARRARERGAASSAARTGFIGSSRGVSAAVSPPITADFFSNRVLREEGGARRWRECAISEGCRGQLSCAAALMRVYADSRGRMPRKRYSSWLA